MYKLNAAKGKTAENETGEVVSPEQLKEIQALVSVKDFAPARFVEALKHYEVETIGELTSAQADDFIARLNKEADK